MDFMQVFYPQIVDNLCIIEFLAVVDIFFLLVGATSSIQACGQLFHKNPVREVIHSCWGYSPNHFWISELSPSRTRIVDKLWLLWITSPIPV